MNVDGHLSSGVCNFIGVGSMFKSNIHIAS